MVAKKTEALSRPMVEYGASGLRQFSGYIREEFLRDLTGWKGLRMYREMRDNDPIIGAMFFAVERLLLSVKFTVEPASADPQDAEAAQFIESCIGDMEQSWQEILTEFLTVLQYGWAVQEIVYKRRKGRSDNPQLNSKYSDGMIGWRKFAGRAQESLLHWDFDESGDACAMVQLLPTGGPLLRIPLAKCLHFRTRMLKNNPEGVSLLRNAYVPYYRKKRVEEIEAVGLERDLCGIPIAWVPARLLAGDASANDKAQLESFKSTVRDTVRNEQEGFVLPLAYDANGNKMYDLTLLSTGGRRQFDTTSILDRYDDRIAATWLADFLMLGKGSNKSQGTGAQSSGKTDLFMAAIVTMLDLFESPVNRKAIPDLLTLNQIDGVCMLKHGKIEEGAVGEFASAVQALTTVGQLTPDSNTEAFNRGRLGMPMQAGINPDDVNTGSDVKGENTDLDPAETSDESPDAGEGQGAGGDAADTYIPAVTRPATKRRTTTATRSPLK